MTNGRGRFIKIAVALLAGALLVTGGWLAGRAGTQPIPTAASATGASGTGLEPESPPASTRTAPNAAAANAAPAADRPLPPTTAPLREILAELRGRANAGEGAAACRLAAEMDYCENIRGRLAGEAAALRRSSWLEEALKKATSPEQQKGLRAAQGAMVAKSERLLEESRHCEGTPEFSADERVRHWRTAAQAGNVPALRQYAVGNAFRLNDSLDNLDELRTYRAEAEAMAWRAVKAGDLPAAMALAQAYSPVPQGGRRYLLAQSVRPDAARALGLSLLVQSRMGEGPRLPRGMPNPVTTAIEDLESELTADAVARARRDAAEYDRDFPASETLDRQASMRLLFGGGTPDIGRHQCGGER